jgi:hypothetical protein
MAHCAGHWPLTAVSCSRPTRPAASTAGRRFTPSARGWTNSSAGKLAMKVWNLHLPKWILGGHRWRAWPVEAFKSNAGVAPLWLVTANRFVLGKKVRSRGEFGILSVRRSASLCGGRPGHALSSWRFHYRSNLMPRGPLDGHEREGARGFQAFARRAKPVGGGL